MNKELLDKLSKIEEVEPLEDEVKVISSMNCKDNISLNEVKKELKQKEDADKFILRLPKSIGKKLRKEAEAEGVSLNQFILMTASYYLGHKDC